MSINKKIIPFLFIVHAYLCHVKARDETNLTNKRVLIIFSKPCRCPVGIGPRQRNRARPYSHFELQKEIGRRSPDCGRLFFCSSDFTDYSPDFPDCSPDSFQDASTAAYPDEQHSEQNEEEVKGLGPEVLLVEKHSSEKEGYDHRAAAYQRNHGNHCGRVLQGSQIADVGKGYEK